MVTNRYQRTYRTYIVGSLLPIKLYSYAGGQEDHIVKESHVS